MAKYPGPDEIAGQITEDLEDNNGLAEVIHFSDAFGDKFGRRPHEYDDEGRLKGVSLSTPYDMPKQSKSHTDTGWITAPKPVTPKAPSPAPIIEQAPPQVPPQAPPQSPSITPVFGQTERKLIL